MVIRAALTTKKTKSTKGTAIRGYEALVIGTRGTGHGGGWAGGGSA